MPKGEALHRFHQARTNRTLVAFCFSMTKLQRDILDDFAKVRLISRGELMRRILEDTIDSWIKGGVIPSPHWSKSFYQEAAGRQLDYRAPYRTEPDHGALVAEGAGSPRVYKKEGEPSPTAARSSDD